MTSTARENLKKVTLKTTTARRRKKSLHQQYYSVHYYAL